MKAVIATLCSFFIPGLGQLFYGEIAWGIIWFLLAFVSCGLANILSAVHCIMIAAK